MDIEEGTADGVRHGTSTVLANSGVNDEPAGLGPGSEALAQMQNLHKVRHSWHGRAAVRECRRRSVCCIARRSMAVLRGTSACVLQVYGRHVAVHNLTLPLRVDEMTALLGHNGAGAARPSITYPPRQHSVS